MLSIWCQLVLFKSYSSSPRRDESQSVHKFWMKRKRKSHTSFPSLWRRNEKSRTFFSIRYLFFRLFVCFILARFHSFSRKLKYFPIRCVGALLLDWNERSQDRCEHTCTQVSVSSWLRMGKENELISPNSRDNFSAHTTQCDFMNIKCTRRLKRWLSVNTNGGENLTKQMQITD